MRSLKSKRGQLGALPATIIALVVAVIVLVMGIVIVQEIRDTDIVSPGTCPTNASQCTEIFSAANDSLSGLGDFADFIPIIVIAVAASIIIGLILVGFAFSGRGR